MSQRTARTARRETDLLRRITESARRHADLQRELDAEKERRDTLITQAITGGYTYGEVQAAARAGDGHATVSLVQNAVKDVLGGRYDEKRDQLRAPAQG